MQQRLPSLRDSPIAFAHRGARAHAPENTLESFSLALRLGATGLESDVWITKDGVAVLDHDGVVRRGLRRTPIAELTRDQLPEHIPTLAQLFDQCGVDYELSLDIKDARAFKLVVDIADNYGFPRERFWLCYWDLDILVAMRSQVPSVRLVNSTRLNKISEGLERRAHRLRENSIDSLNLHHSDWNGGSVALVHRFDVFAFSWDLQFDDALHTAYLMGVDAVYSDHVDRMMDCYRDVLGRP